MLGNTFLRQVLDGEYPKLVRLYSDLWRRIQSLGGAALATSIDQMSVGAGSDAENISSIVIVDNSPMTLSVDDNDYESVLSAVSMHVCMLVIRDVTKFAFEFNNFELRTFSADSKFVEFFHIPVVEFEPQVYTIGTTCLCPPATRTTN